MPYLCFQKSVLSPVATASLNKYLCLIETIFLSHPINFNLLVVLAGVFNLIDWLSFLVGMFDYGFCRVDKAQKSMAWLFKYLNKS